MVDNYNNSLQVFKKLCTLNIYGVAVHRTMYRNLAFGSGNFFSRGIRNPAIFFCGIQDSSLGNPEYRLRNPGSTKQLHSKILFSTGKESGIHDMKSRLQDRRYESLMLIGV